MWKGDKKMKIKMEFTVDELNIINKALTGYEKDLMDYYDAAKAISVNAISAAQEITNIRELNQRIRDKKWESSLSDDMKKIVKRGEING